jgi:hypothetical protein
LPFLVQSPWNLGTQLKALLDFSQLQAESCYRPAAKENAENTVLLLRSADHTENTNHVIAKHCWDVTLLRLRGSVYTEPLPRSGLHNPVVSLLRRALLSNGCFCESTILAWSKYTIIKLIIMLVVVVILVVLVAVKSGNNLEVRKKDICIYKDTIYIIMRNVTVMITIK